MFVLLEYFKLWHQASSFMLEQPPLPPSCFRCHVISANRSVRTVEPKWATEHVTAHFPTKIIKMPKALHLVPKVCVLSGLCAIIRGLFDTHWPAVCCCSAATTSSRAQVCICVLSSVWDELSMAQDRVCDHFAGMCACISVCVAMQPVNP